MRYCLFHKMFVWSNVNFCASTKPLRAFYYIFFRTTWTWTWTVVHHLFNYVRIGIRKVKHASLDYLTICCRAASLPIVCIESLAKLCRSRLLFWHIVNILSSYLYESVIIRSRESAIEINAQCANINIRVLYNLLQNLSR